MLHYLPNQCKHGYIVKISNSRMSEEDDYYLRFDGQIIEMDLAHGQSVQKVVYLRLLTNMPLVIQRTATDYIYS